MSEALVAGADKPAKRELSKLQIQVAMAYGRGMRRAEIARAYLEHLSPNSVGRPMDKRLRLARQRLRNWELNQTFRDRVYNHAVTTVDLAVPQILDGVVQRAKRGRIDAARLALEVTGRHNPKGDHAPPTVVIAIDGIARPQSPRQIADAEVVDAVER